VLPALPTIVAFWRVTDVTVGALTTRAPVTLEGPTAPPMLAVMVVARAEVVAVKVALLLPAGMLTEPGTWATALSELSVTVTPPVGA